MSIQYIKAARAKKKKFDQDVEKFNSKQHLTDQHKAQILLRLVVQLMGVMEFENMFGSGTNSKIRMRKELDDAKQTLEVMGIQL